MLVNAAHPSCFRTKKIEKTAEKFPVIPRRVSWRMMNLPSRLFVLGVLKQGFHIYIAVECGMLNKGSAAKRPALTTNTCASCLLHRIPVSYFLKELHHYLVLSTAPRPSTTKYREAQRRCNPLPGERIKKRIQKRSRQPIFSSSMREEPSSRVKRVSDPTMLRR